MKPEDSVSDFLGGEAIGVAGVSRKGDTAANYIYRKLRDRGYRVYAINPNAGQVEGDTCYPDISALPERIDGLVIGCHPDQAPDLVRQCRDAGVSRIWFHRSIGQGSYDEEAARQAREAGITVIPRGCPMMFCEPVDVFHKCLRWFTFR
ncbi:CoA-binding protein [Balneolales bacterium ANBcel1]|nr:CoA-binding protein [Balneolales bacterium ANBcel1]